MRSQRSLPMSFFHCQKRVPTSECQSCAIYIVLVLIAGTIYSLNGWGLSIVDSIDTMYLMGLKPEYKRALDHVKRMHMSDTVSVSSPPKLAAAYTLCIAIVYSVFRNDYSLLGRSPCGIYPHLGDHLSYPGRRTWTAPITCLYLAIGTAVLLR